MGTDKHYLGRDPRGQKENKKRLSFETKSFLDALEKNGVSSKYKQMIMESSIEDDPEIDG
jgi:hypothetical protein